MVKCEKHPTMVADEGTVELCHDGTAGGRIIIRAPLDSTIYIHDDPEGPTEVEVSEYVGQYGVTIMDPFTREVFWRG